MIRTFIEIITDNIRVFPSTVVLAKTDMSKKNRASDLGWFWTMVRPVMYILMFYMAITLGFRSAKKIDGLVVPYFVWISAGIVAWFYVQDLIIGGANCFRSNKKLFKKIYYPMPAIPMIPVISNLFLHLMVIGIMFVMALLAGAKPCVYWLQLPVYLLLSMLFCYFWSFCMGLITTVTPDFIEFIKTIRPAFFWLSGILFNSRTSNRLLFKINPITFIVEGYRNSMCFNQWIWEDTDALKGFGLVMLILILVTVILYRKLGKRIPEIA